MDFSPTNITRRAYLDVIEQVVDAYGTDLLERQLALEDAVYHCTAFRTCLMLAHLIASGRRPELLSLWQKAAEKTTHITMKRIRLRWVGCWAVLPSKRMGRLSHSMA